MQKETQHIKASNYNSKGLKYIKKLSLMTTMKIMKNFRDLDKKKYGYEQ